MDKRHYSAFSGTDLDVRLRERGVDTVVLTGVLSDICVLHTAIDAYNKGYRIEVVSSAILCIDGGESSVCSQPFASCTRCDNY